MIKTGDLVKFSQDVHRKCYSGYASFNDPKPVKIPLNSLGIVVRDDVPAEKFSGSWRDCEVAFTVKSGSESMIVHAYVLTRSLEKID